MKENLEWPDNVKLVDYSKMSSEQLIGELNSMSTEIKTLENKISILSKKLVPVKSVPIELLREYCIDFKNIPRVIGVSKDVYKGYELFANRLIEKFCDSTEWLSEFDPTEPMYEKEEQKRKNPFKFWK